MNDCLKSYIMLSVFTATMKLAKDSGGVRPDGMDQANFERSIAREIAQQATNLAHLDDQSLDIVRKAIVK